MKASLSCYSNLGRAREAECVKKVFRFSSLQWKEIKYCCWEKKDMKEMIKFCIISYERESARVHRTATIQPYMKMYIF